MTYLEFMELALPSGCPSPFRWCLYKKDEREEKGLDEHDDWELDFNSPEGVEDGVYFVYYINPTLAAYGLTIENGQYVLEPSLEAINKAVRRDLINHRTHKPVTPDQIINHVYIERLEYVGNGLFNVNMGS